MIDSFSLQFAAAVPELIVGEVVADT